MAALAPPAATERVALVPTPTSLPVPTSTRPPVLATATSGLLEYTPLPTFGAALPTYPVASSPLPGSSNQLFYVQGGNLWSIDDSGNNARRLTDGGDISGITELVWTPNGDQVAFVNRKNELVMLALGLEVRPPLFFKPAVSNLTPLEPAWSPDGRYLAFTLKPLDLTASLAGEVWLADLQSSKPGLQKLDNGFAPAWSLDGRYLAYLSRSGEKESGTTEPPTPTRFAGPTPQGTSLLPPTPTATAAPLRLDNNALVIYNRATKSTRRLFQTSDLLNYPSLDGQRNFDVKPSVLARLWWSPDSRYIAFADRNSYLGVVNAGGGTPTMWVGLPEAFAVQKVSWLPASNAVLFSWNNPGSDDRTFLGLINNLGTPPKTGELVPNPMSSKGRVSFLPSEWANCPTLSPAGDLIAYSDPKLQALVIVRLDWSVYSLLPGGNCAAWSPDARSLSTTLRNAEDMLATLSSDLTGLKPFSEARGASQLYWQRPAILPSDLNLLTPAPANSPAPGVTPLKPDKVSPPPAARTTLSIPAGPTKVPTRR